MNGWSCCQVNSAAKEYMSETPQSDGNYWFNMQTQACSWKDVTVIQFHWQTAVVIISEDEAKKKSNGKWPHSKCHALFHYYDIQASKCEGILVGCKQTSQRQRKWAVTWKEFHVN